VEIRTHGIVHLEHAFETLEAKLEERVETITNLELQLLQLQEPAPPVPVDQ
jgi:FtsZ-binding cell division protein ZapB